MLCVIPFSFLLFLCLNECKFIYVFMYSVSAVLQKLPCAHQNLRPLKIKLHLSVNTNHQGPVSLKLTYLLRSVLAGQQNVSGLVSDERGLVIYGLPAERCHIAAMEGFLTFCHLSVALLLAVFICRDSQDCAPRYLGKGQTESLIMPLLWLTKAF